jgi:hypothetical protein
MTSVFAFAAIVLTVAFGREWLLVKQTGWDRLSQEYRCRVPFAGKYKPCWWAQITVPRAKFDTVANVGHLTRWRFRLEFPPFWVGAGPEGLYLKKNVWNLLHPTLLIPWDRIQSANEVTYTALVGSRYPGTVLAGQPMALHPHIAAAQGLTGPLLELKLSEPSLSIIGQFVAFEEVRRFLGAKLKLLNSQAV